MNQQESSKKMKRVALRIGVAMLALIGSIGAILSLASAVSPNHKFVLCGRVVDLDGKPIAGAVVSGTFIYEKNLIPILWNSNSGGKVVTTTTAADGSFTLGGYGHTLNVDLQKEGWRSEANLYFTVMAGQNPVTSDPSRPIIYTMSKGKPWPK